MSIHKLRESTILVYCNFTLLPGMFVLLTTWKMTRIELSGSFVLFMLLFKLG